MPRSASALRYAATISGVAGNAGTARPAHQASNAVKSDRYAFLVVAAFSALGEIVGPIERDLLLAWPGFWLDCKGATGAFQIAWFHRRLCLRITSEKVDYR
jgi:hypothetical protein